MTNAHNAYVALAKQVTGQPKRQHVALKREEAILLLKEKEEVEAKLRELQTELKKLQAKEK